MTIMTPAAAVIGQPIAHSKSPVIHGFWLKQLGLEGVYKRIEVAPDDLDAFMQSLSASGLRGINVTLPHKQSVIAHCDSLTSVATLVGAVNTIVVQPDGRLLGQNTDITGIRLPLSFQDWTGKTAVVIGNGGAARAALHSFRMMGVGKVRAMARQVSDLALLMKEFGFDPSGAFGMWQSDEALANADLLINATSLGMAGQPQLDLDLGSLHQDAIVFDIVYSSKETRLVETARAAGYRTIDGLDMLVAQATEGFELFFGARPPLDDNSQAELRKLMAA